MIDCGLDLSRLDVTSDEEVAAFRAYYSSHHGTPLPAYDFWLAMDPGQMKRHRLQARWSADEEGLALPLHGTLGFLHLYAIWAYEAGIRYEVLHARSLGCTRAGVLETLALAFVHSGPRGMRAANEACRGVLEGWTDGTVACPPETFPRNWSWDASVFQLGSAWTTPPRNGATAIGRGSPIGIVATSAGHRGTRPSCSRRVRGSSRRGGGGSRGPCAERSRSRCSPPDDPLERESGIRAGDPRRALLARSLGMTSSQIGEAIAWGALYGGPAGVAIAADATSGVL